MEQKTILIADDEADIKKLRMARRLWYYITEVMYNESAGVGRDVPGDNSCIVRKR